MWIYRGKEVKGHSDLHPECTDFVYLITYTNGQKYIGKKTVRSVRKKPPLAGKKRSRRIMTNHPFIKYAGSHADPGLEIEKKEILYQCRTKKAAVYIECALLFEHDAILGDEFLNENISGRFFDNDLDGLLDG